MAAISFESRLDANGAFSIPRETLEALGLNAGDTIRVQIEAAHSLHATDKLDQHELHRRAKSLFEQADRIVRDPGKRLKDPLEAAWGEGVEEKARRMGIKI